MIELKTANELTSELMNEYPTTKIYRFANVVGSFDYSLPQYWLDGITKFAIGTGRLDVNYDLILSTTVWHYENGHGRPLTCCKEVAELIEQYNNS